MTSYNLSSSPQQYNQSYVEMAKEYDLMFKVYDDEIQSKEKPHS